MISYKKHFFSIFIVFLLIFFNVGSAMSSFAETSYTNEVSVISEDGKINTIPDKVLSDAIAISENDAIEVAKLFIQDAITFEDVEWDENTVIKDIVEMYDQTDEHNITAYSIELDRGYVVVSASLDFASLIPEWSDTTEPIYTAFENNTGNILYLGAYEYYFDLGNEKVEDLNGNIVKKKDLINQLEETRSINNIPDLTLQQISEFYEHQDDFDQSGISNPITDADNNYGGPFICSDYVNNWDPYAKFKKTSDFDFYGYHNHCGPTAITNLILTYGNRYPTCIVYSSDSSVFSNVVNIGISNGYYSSASGTNRSTVGNYIRDSFSSYAITTNITGRYNVNYSNIRSKLLNDAILYISLYDHLLYENHAVMCYAYTRLISQTTGSYKTYLKVSDGWNSSARYIDLASAESSKFWSVQFP